jgi:hypothetical protein
MSRTRPRRTRREKGFVLEALRRSPLVGADLDLARPREEGRTGALLPNVATVEAMRAARRGDLVTVGRVADLLANLHKDD